MANSVCLSVCQKPLLLGPHLLYTDIIYLIEIRMTPGLKICHLVLGPISDPYYGPLSQNLMASNEPI